MVETEGDCLMIAQQLQAVVNALSNAKTLHVQDHIEHCLAEALSRRGGSPPDISSFKEIAKYL
jgi:DNA-binding FrmR family transcriptional regulator